MTTEATHRWAVLSGLAALLALNGCEPECFTTNDCRAVGSRGVCRRGVCVAEDAGVDGGQIGGGAAGSTVVAGGGEASGGGVSGGGSSGGNTSGGQGGGSSGGNTSGGQGGGSSGGSTSGGQGGGSSGGSTSGGQGGGSSGGSTSGGPGGGSGMSGGIAGGGMGGGSAGGSGGGEPPVLGDGGVFIATLNGLEAVFRLPDGGADMSRSASSGSFRLGFRGPTPGGTYQAQWTLTHDANAAQSLQIRNAVAGRIGPVLNGMQQGLPQQSGSWDVDPSTLAQVTQGRAYVALVTQAQPDGLIRGQLVPLNWSVAAFAALRSPVPGFDAEGGVGGFLSGATYRYEGDWSSNVVGTASHVHLADGGVALAMAVLPDGSGVRGIASAGSLINCRTLDSGCYVDVHNGNDTVLRQQVP
jgi:hypothetical protein